MKDSKSTSGYVFLLGGAAISWKSSKQTVIARSTMESEFIALDKSGEEAEWLRQFVEDIPQWPKPLSAICIHCDSESAIGRSQRSMYNGKSRHMRRRHNTIRQLLSTGVITIDHVRSEDNIVKLENKREKKKSNSRGRSCRETQISGLSNIVFHQLDISDPSSIASLAKFVQTRFGKLDILINNAGDSGLIIHEDEFRAGGGFLQVLDDNPHRVTNILEEPYEVGEKCVKTNYYATKMVTESLIPLLQLSKSPRIENLTSFFGDLYRFHNEKLKEELQDVDNLTVKRIDEIVEWFLSDFKAGKVQENGWPRTLSSYKVSKAALNAYTRLMAKKYENILVNCVHPGYVITYMTSQTGMITVEEGAKGLVMAALLPEKGPSGVYFNETQIAPFLSTGLKTN
ncbi:(+)-neomenthol dehydrogenase-like [Bidens hawaiensis]|uniref:(+)-neomenthol dehydrogenase-like n=1 Tax=Bidens hawaiensis TaxID=980011 RepID=UPI00404A4673